MQAELIVSPDALTLNTVYANKITLFKGTLTTQLDAIGENLEPNIETLLQHPEGTVNVVLSKDTASIEHPVQLLLPSLISFIALHLYDKTQAPVEVQTLIENWKKYFSACQQLLMHYPEYFVAKHSEHADHRQAIAFLTYAIMLDDELSDLHAEWSTFVSGSNNNLQPLDVFAAGLSETLSDIKENAQKYEVIEHCLAKAKTLASHNLQLKNEELNELTLRLLCEEQTKIKNENVIAALEARLAFTNQQNETLQTENKILSLQINHLQDELEHQFLASTGKSISSEKSVNVKKLCTDETLTLLQNSKEQANERLCIRVSYLVVGDISIHNYEFSIQAKRVRTDGFTTFGTLDFKIQRGGKSPLPDWQYNVVDRWGKRLSLELSPHPSSAQLKKLRSVSEKNRIFIDKLLATLIEKLSVANTNGIVLHRPIHHWQNLVSSMKETLDSV